ncbi:MAG: glucose 1-dehydrogenase [Anaerolineae bacterium]|nr:glucose 1-dehydrogenase [Anaerolineae bacterium]
MSNKVIVITGAGSGFGAAMAKHIAANFVPHGCAVVVADLNLAAAHVVAAEIVAAGGQALAAQVDVTNGASVAALVSNVLAAYGRLDVWVNNAGVIYKISPLEQADEATFDRVFAVNVKGAYHAAVHVVPVMRQQGGGVFLNMASTAGIRPRPGLAWYNASKGAVITLTKSMAVELAPDRIRVNALCPTVADTPLMQQMLAAGDAAAARQRFIDTVPLGRLCTPDDVAKAALFLISDQAEFITGVCLEVDGGRCI